MSIVDINQPNFFGNNGQILANGYIYVGQPYQDPISFEKTVTFRDSNGLEFTATQPLRTTPEGKIAYQGNPITAIVDGSYSITIQDNTQTTIPGGNIPFVEGTDGGGSVTLENYREYGLTLNDLRGLEKTPGETVGSIGRNTTTDNLGSNWLVVSNTGNPADDVELFDFDNGNQGQRIGNFLQTGFNLQEIEDAGAVAQLDAQDNLGLIGSYPGFTRSSEYFIYSPGEDNSIGNLDLYTLPVGLSSSIGPTGSGADFTWVALDPFPLSANYFDCTVFVQLEDNSGVDFLNFNAIFSGSSVGDDPVYALITPSIIASPTGSDLQNEFNYNFRVGLDSNNIFYIRRVVAGTNPDGGANIQFITGFGI